MNPWDVTARVVNPPGSLMVGSSPSGCPRADRSASVTGIWGMRHRVVHPAGVRTGLFRRRPTGRDLCMKIGAFTTLTDVCLSPTHLRVI